MCKMLSGENYIVRVSFTTVFLIQMRTKVAMPMLATMLTDMKYIESQRFETTTENTEYTTLMLSTDTSSL